MYKVEHIKKGNSFYLDYTLRKNSEGVDAPLMISDIEDLKVGVKHSSGRYIDMIPAFVDNVITLHVTPEYQPGCGIFQIVLTGIFQGEAISRNKDAYKLVYNTKDESKGGCSCIEVRRVAISDSIVTWKGVQGSVINVVNELPEVGIPGQFYAIPE